MTIENKFSPEVPSVSLFSEAIERLSNIDNPTPLSSEIINVVEIKSELLAAGIDVSPIENDPVLQKSIKDSQFRSDIQGKGPAVIAVIGQEGYQKFFDWAMKQSQDQPTLNSGDESSKCRGLMQFIGETIALASGQMAPEDFCYKTNWRVGKKYQKDAEISKKFKLPQDEVGLKKLKQTSSIPKGSAIEAYQLILSLKK